MIGGRSFFLFQPHGHFTSGGANGSQIGIVMLRRISVVGFKKIVVGIMKTDEMTYFLFISEIILSTSFL